MPSPKGGCQLRRGCSGNVLEKEKNRKGKLSGKAMSFHSGMTMLPSELGGGDLLRRPRTVPDLMSGGGKIVVVSSDTDARPAKLTKLLLNVTIQRSLGAVQVLISPESTVEDLIAAALRQYVKEGRRPILPVNETASFDLHYSQFSLECLSGEEKLINLGSRNFFLCPKPSVQQTVAVSTSCSKQAVKRGSPWLKIMDFLL